MNTAIQQMIRIMEETMSDSRCDFIIARAIEAQIKLAKGLLQTEKDLIKSAFNAGYDEGISEHDKYEDAGDYFNQTYATTN